MNDFVNLFKSLASNFVFVLSGPKLENIFMACALSVLFYYRIMQYFSITKIID